MAIRAVYVASDELKVRWDLTDRRLLGPGGRIARHAEMEVIRPFAGAVQVITRQGDKHLIKYQGDPGAVAQAIREASGRT